MMLSPPGKESEQRQEPLSDKCEHCLSSENPIGHSMGVPTERIRDASGEMVVVHCWARLSDDERRDKKPVSDHQAGQSLRSLTRALAKSNLKRRNWKR